ncbi:FecR family protein [Chitinophaga qingshengii]|uniref:FecR domain-containing protein n=1 Tax=Chitinophaga qingshengii TaxID=1569794 RepID=A0ABR7TF98_9BACT|nr:FecR family protein [Chitinophaga qingshengii]MBC9928996.1 FecR domain-containing protein [Chitinophaga qingshengii]
MSTHLEDLIRQSFNGALPAADRQMLRDLLQQTDNEVLENVLSGIWMEYEGSIPAKTDIDELISGLPIRRNGRVTAIFGRAAKIAASILLLLALGAGLFYYYAGSKKWGLVAASTITIESRNGGATNVKLPDSSLVILRSGATFDYPASFSAGKREVKLNRGEAYFEITKNQQAPFLVTTDWLTIEVLGTTFNVKAYDRSDSVETALVEGAVRITTKGRKPETIVLQPNEKAVYNKTNGKLSISKADMESEIAWMQDTLLFKSTKFSDVIKKLGQKYNTVIKIEGNRYNNDTFTGTLEGENIEVVLSALQLHYHFSYRRSGSMITIQVK